MQSQGRKLCFRGTTLITALNGHSVKLQQASCHDNGASRNRLLYFQQFCSGMRLKLIFSYRLSPTADSLKRSYISNNSFNAFLSSISPAFSFVNSFLVKKFSFLCYMHTFLLNMLAKNVTICRVYSLVGDDKA